jgi:hypothetical protein
MKSQMFLELSMSSLKMKIIAVKSNRLWREMEGYQVVRGRWTPVPGKYRSWEARDEDYSFL